MKYRILAILALIMLSIFAYKESSFVDLDEEATKAWASVYIAKDGDTEFIEKLSSGLETRDYQIIANTALRAAEKIKNPRSKKYDKLPYSKDIYRIILLNHELDKPSANVSAYESRIDFLKSKTEKTKLYARLAKAYYDKGDVENYNRLIAKAFDTSLNLPPLISRNSLAFALDIVLRLDDVDNFFKYAPLCPDCPAKSLSLLDIMKRPNIEKEYLIKNKDKEYTNTAKYRFYPGGHYYFVEWKAKRLTEKNYHTLKENYIYFHKDFCNLPLAKTQTNQPALAYHAYINNREGLYEHLKKDSFSEKQRNGVLRAYPEYVGYCAIIFLKTGETQEVIDLIKTIDNKQKRNAVLRKNILHILNTEDGLEILKKEDLL